MCISILFSKIMIGSLIQNVSVQNQHFFPYLIENTFLRNSENNQELA